MCKVGKEKKSCTRKKDNLAQAMGENKNQTVIPPPLPSPSLPSLIIFLMVRPKKLLYLHLTKPLVVFSAFLVVKKKNNAFFLVPCQFILKI